MHFLITFTVDFLWHPPLHPVILPSLLLHYEVVLASFSNRTPWNEDKSILRTPTLHCPKLPFVYIILPPWYQDSSLDYSGAFCVFCPKGVQINSGFTLVLHPSHRARVLRERKVGWFCGHLMFGLWFSKLLGKVLGFSSKGSYVYCHKLGCEPLEFS